MKAIIKKGHKYFRFLLVGSNGEIIATSEHYTAKQNVLDTISSYFPGIEVEDKTVRTHK